MARLSLINYRTDYKLQLLETPFGRYTVPRTISDPKITHNTGINHEQLNKMLKTRNNKRKKCHFLPCFLQ